MKKLMLILALLLGTLSFVACGKKDKSSANSCDGYPAGYVRITDQRMLQMLNSSGGSSYGSGYNSGYNNYNNSNVVCVEQYRYQQLQQQLYGSGQSGQVNCQQYPSAQGCQSQGGSGYPPSTGGGGDPYCDYYPYSAYCMGYGY